MADDDNFDIDIYGDDTSPDYQDAGLQDEVKQDTTPMHTDPHVDVSTDAAGEPENTAPAVEQETRFDAAANGDSRPENGTQQIASTGGSTDNQVQPPKQAPRQQGMKRKQGDDDDRPMAPGATSALMINDLNWWVSEEDIRGWANQGGCEDELLDVTFNEHKVNGKSKGQVYVNLQSPQAATALKEQIENLYEGQTHAKKPSAIFNLPHSNPFKTLPKDVPARDKNRGDRSSSGNFSGNQTGGGGNFNNRFNNRGNFNNRGTQNNMGFQGRNFSGPSGGNMGGNMGAGGFGGPAPMNNFGGGPMGGMNNFGGGFNRGGGMMGGNMRGGMNNRGRGGGMGMNNMGGGMGMPMGGNMMGMGGNMMGMGGNMGMMGGMGGPGGFGGNQPHFNPAFFNQNQGGGDDIVWPIYHDNFQPKARFDYQIALDLARRAGGGFTNYSGDTDDESVSMDDSSSSASDISTPAERLT